MYFPDGLCGGHVVDAGIQTQFAQKQKSLFLGRSVQFMHVLLDVGGVDVMDALFDAGGGHWSHQVRREQVDHNVRSDLVDETAGIPGSITDKSRAAFVVFRHSLEVFVIDIDDGDVMGRVPKQILDARFRYTPGSQYENFFHNKHLP